MPWRWAGGRSKFSGGGAIERVPNLTEKGTMLSENGAQTVVVPLDNLSEIATVRQSVLGLTDMPFFSISQMLMQKAGLME